ncbi:hypothetical protein [Parabacteroides pacaensis]|uniref:hypothetical protein n=1 Tax=Parabacteroides pacaensis TaxID=2086575 RepID=UPI0018FE8DA3|nr:hypothetical protein [Parabacteroides pacaensis]
MNITNKKDILDTLFSRLPEEPLPKQFRSNLMEQIQAEAIRIQKRKERYGLAAIIVASLSMIGLAVIILYKFFTPASIDSSIFHISFHLDLPKVTFPSLSDYSFAAYIGILSLVLLAFDYYLRRLFKKHTQKSSPNEL